MTRSNGIEVALDYVASELGGIDIAVDIIGGSRWGAGHLTGDVEWKLDDHEQPQRRVLPVPSGRQTNGLNKSRAGHL